MHFFRQPVPNILPSFGVHSMENHYANLKPYHKELPSTLALLNDLNIYEIVNNEFDDDGDEPKFVKEIF